MKKYYVTVKEVHYQPVLIEASSPEEAINKVAEGEGQVLEDQLEYAYTLDKDEFEVHEAKV